MLLYQDLLVSKINKYIESKSLPRTLMFEGEYGCGKHTMSNYIAKRLDVEFEDITESLTLETIEQISLSVIPRVYYIDTSSISVKEQNVILKFLEEPAKGAYIILGAENRNRLLNTVINRCVVFEFSRYDIDSLRKFLPEGTSEIVLRYAATPGKVIEFSKHNIEEIEAFATKILTQIKDANYSNILKIPSKIDFGKDPQLFDFSIFSYILVNVANSLYKLRYIPFDIFDITSKFYTDCYIPKINKQYLFEHYLIALKQGFEKE